MLYLKEKYNKEVLPAMMKRFSYKDKMAVPKIEKVILNIGFGKKTTGKSGKEREKIQEDISKKLNLIAGQKLIATIAKKSISGFKVRKGVAVGLKTTLRGQKMYDFIDRLIHIALPRSRDFRGINQESVDGAGNLTIGIKEHIIFPETPAERAQDILSFGITITTNAKTKEEGLELFRLLGFPIKGSI